MSQARNPFTRGFQNLRIERCVCVVCVDGQIIRRPLYPDQAYLPDDWITQVPCLFNGDFALITDQDTPDDIAPEILEDLDSRFPASGMAQNVVYTITSDNDNDNDDDGPPVHVGDVYSREAAENVVRRLNFETGAGQGCRAIGTAHLSAEAERYLADLVDDALAGFLFVPFRIPGDPAIGVKLIATPWTDENLQHVEGFTARELQQRHLFLGVPDTLARVLHLAARAGVRVLIFDADAPELDGLPVYDL
jgi:hypothetical protein